MKTNEILNEFKEYHLSHAPGDVVGANYSYTRSGCCLDDSAVAIINDVVEVLLMDDDGTDEPTGAALVKRTDGTFWAFEDWQDYSGHGCQCGTEIAGPYNTANEAVMFGLTDAGRKLLGLNPETGEAV